MDIPLNAPVICADGPGGHSKIIVMNPVNDTVTHVVVREADLLGIEVMMPVDWITESTPDEIHARCTIAELAECQPFQEMDYMTPDAPYIDTLGANTVLWPYATLDPAVSLPTHDNVPENEIELRRGTDIYATDGHVGHIDELLVDSNNTVTHLVMRQGHLWGQQDITLPLSDIDRFEDNTIHLRLSKEQIGALPHHSITRAKWV